jgi:hypothetical protein
MKKGDQVTVYIDPITREREEGEAIVVKPIMSDDNFAGDGERYTYATVLFTGDAWTFERWVHDPKA